LQSRDGKPNIISEKKRNEDKTFVWESEQSDKVVKLKDIRLLKDKKAQETANDQGKPMPLLFLVALT